MTVLLLASNGTGVFAQSTKQSTPIVQENSDCDCGDEDNLTDIPEGITELSNKDIKKIAGKLHKEKSYREALKWFKENRLEVSNIVAGLHMDKLVFNSGETFNNINHIAFNGVSDNKKNRGLIVAVIDDETNELLHLKADIFYNISEDGFEEIQTFTLHDGLGNKITKAELDKAKEGQITTMGFSPCVHTSVWVCVYHCGLWAVVNGVAGLACGALCAYAFSYACS